MTARLHYGIPRLRRIQQVAQADTAIDEFLGPVGLKFRARRVDSFELPGPKEWIDQRP
jgi:hypothetical protein